MVMLAERAGLIAYVVRMISGWLAEQIEQALRPIRLTHVPMAALLLSRVVCHLGSGQTRSAAAAGHRSGSTSSKPRSPCTARSEPNTPQPNSDDYRTVYRKPIARSGCDPRARPHRAPAGGVRAGPGWVRHRHNRIRVDGAASRDRASSLRVSEPAARHVISAYAHAVVVGAPVLAELSVRVARKTLLTDVACSPPPHSSCSPARYSCDTEPGVQCGREPTRSARCWSRPHRRSTEPGTSSTTFRSHELRTRWIPTPR